MKTLNLNEMENIEGGGLLRNCFLAGANTILGLVTIPWGGAWLALASISTAAGLGCFDY